MNDENKEVIEITENTLYDWYVDLEMYDIMDFNEYRRGIEKSGHIVIKDNNKTNA